VDVSDGGSRDGSEDVSDGGDEPFEHRPVMSGEVVDLLGPVPAGLVVDGTVGGGGHAAAILRARPDVRLLGIDRDPAAVAAAGAALAPFGERARIVQGGFEGVADIVGSERSEGIVGILFDLGVSSAQLNSRVRGFSYWAEDAPLDMRMDSSQTLTAAHIVNEYSEADLAALIADNGEERYARRIAAKIVAARPLHTTGDLVEAVKAGIPAPARRRGGHPARRTFQAIRIEVNHELPNLASGLDESVHLLAPEGRMLVLAYHSLEDRMVKERFVDWSRTEEPDDVPRELPRRPRTPLVRMLTRRPLRPTEAEVEENPRAASARLRAVERLR
jgi:16S rRNA (cytosine1402-N4)-methyltransferase